MARAVVSSGVPGLDECLGGGLPEGQAFLVTGVSGSGKTVLCTQIAFALAARGESVVLATTTTGSHDKLLEDLDGFEFFDRARLGSELFLLSAYPALKRGPKDAREMLLDAVRDRRAKLLVVEGIGGARDLWREDALFREFLYELNVALSATRCTTLLTTGASLGRVIEEPEATTLDGIVGLSIEQHAAAAFRRIEVHKIRGRAHLTGRHTMRITAGGIVVYPRLEAMPRLDRAYEPSAERCAFDLPELDAILRGGVRRDTATVLAGATGVGKTLLALHFAAAGARRGERSLLYAFMDPSGALVARARGVGLDLEPLLRSGALRIEYPPPIEADADELVDEVLAKVRSAGAARLVVDGCDELTDAVLEPGRTKALLTALLVRLRHAGVTSLFTKEIAKVVGPELDVGDTPLAMLAENLLLLRYVELRSVVHRVLSVLTLRDSGFDASLREVRIGADGGVRVLAALESAGGLLTGQARPLGASAQTGGEA
jgi:circadian clock protein KaiC